jgi:hypothetical protein
LLPCAVFGAWPGRHVLRVHLNKGVRPAIHDKVVLLIEVGALPHVVRAAVVDEERPFVLLAFFAGRLQPAPLGF